jgi:hypothetical protein
VVGIEDLLLPGARRVVAVPEAPEGDRPSFGLFCGACHCGISFDSLRRMNLPAPDAHFPRRIAVPTN